MIKNLLRKLFLIKEIKSKAGEIHFQRYRLFSCRFFSIYLHHILKSDEDRHPHNHPWSFISIILSGGYLEDVWKNDMHALCNTKARINIDEYTRTCYNNPIAFRDCKDFHQIELLQPTWTLVFTGPRRLDEWGYLTESGFKHHIEYRKEKNDTK